MSRLDGSGVRAVGLTSSDLMAVNARGELLILLKSSQWTRTAMRNNAKFVTFDKAVRHLLSTGKRFTRQNFVKTIRARFR